MSVSQVVSSPEDLKLNYRGLAIEKRLDENNVSRSSRYLEHLEVSLGSSRRLRTVPEALLNDVVGDGNCAYRAIILGLEHLELSNTPVSDRQSVSVLNDDDEVFGMVRSMKNNMFDTMMLAVTGFELGNVGKPEAETISTRSSLNVKNKQDDSGRDDRTRQARPNSQSFTGTGKYSLSVFS